MSRPGVVDAYADWTDTSKAEELCLTLSSRAGADVLDLGCGAGRFALRLQGELGSYLGVDASEEMLEAASANCPDLAFESSDILEFQGTPQSWDLILLMGNVLDYLHPLERRDTLLSRCAEWVRPGGSVIGSSHLAVPSTPAGYYPEDYHGAQVQNHRASMGEIVVEVESHGLEVALVCRDYRDRLADWCYWVAQLPG